MSRRVKPKSRTTVATIFTEEIESAETNPWWPDALRLRRYDDAAKVPHGDAASIDDVLAGAKRVLAQRDSRSAR